MVACDAQFSRDLDWDRLWMHCQPGRDQKMNGGMNLVYSDSISSNGQENKQIASTTGRKHTAMRFVFCYCRFHVPFGQQTVPMRLVKPKYHTTHKYLVLGHSCLVTNFPQC